MPLFKWGKSNNINIILTTLLVSAVHWTMLGVGEVYLELEDEGQAAGVQSQSLQWWWLLESYSFLNY